jgi:hypothetical protein
MFSGCRDPQTSSDTYDAIEKKGVGAFTQAFLDSMKNNNYSVALPKLYKDVSILLKTRGFTQEPVFSSSSNNPYYIFNPVNILNSKDVTATNKPTIAPAVTTATAPKNRIYKTKKMSMML